MALSSFTKHWLFVSSLIYIFVSACKFGKAYDYPHLGAAGAVANEYLPQAEVEGDRYGNFPQAGIIGTGASILFNKALGCFGNKYIYSECDEVHRLHESGELHVAPEYTDEYCDGPCLAETRHVLDCVNGILRTFTFYNKATLKDMEETIESGCSHGPRRGNFDVLSHIQADRDSANKMFNPVLSVLALMIVGWLLVLF